MCIACEAVDLTFADSRIDGLRQQDEVQDLRLCEEPTGVAMSLDAATGPFQIGEACSDPNACVRPLNKCTLVDGVGADAYDTVCVAPTGSLRLGQCCERRGRGDDDCAPGGWCTPLGIGSVEEGPMACRQICRQDEDCAGTERCLALGDEVGLCVAPCRIFGDECEVPQIRCAAGASVDGDYFGYCARYGRGLTDQPCGSDADCGEDYVCEQDSASCRQMCDDEHACPEEERCLPLGLGDPDSPRICRP